MKTKVRLIIELDGVELTDSARKELDRWVATLTEDIERDLKGGEIVSDSWWEFRHWGEGSSRGVLDYIWDAGRHYKDIAFSKMFYTKEQLEDDVRQAKRAR